MRRAVVRAVMAAVLIMLVLAPSQAAAFPLTTCQLALQSTDANNVAIDTAAGGAPDSTAADPFKVDWEGSVSYKGTTTVVIKNYTYGIAVFGVPTPLQGGGTNDAENTEGDGTVGVAANSTLPFKITGLYYVSGRYSGEGGTFRLENLEALDGKDEIKFVISSRRDYEFARDFMTEHVLAQRVGSLESIS